MTEPSMTDSHCTDRSSADARATSSEDERVLLSRSVESPVGTLTVVASHSGIRAVLWAGDDPRRVPAALGETAGADPGAHAVLDAACRQLAEYFAGERIDFDVALDPVGTVFQQRAWTALRSIPFGETVSYGEQADRMGDRNKARAVGAANGKNPISIIVPCHRVVGSGGALTGFAGGLDTKRWLLDHEARVSGTTLPI